jgi:AraC-like DNA-binding protein
MNGRGAGPETNFSLSELAKDAGTSPTVLLRSFTKAVGCTPHTYQTARGFTAAGSFSGTVLLSSRRRFSADSLIKATSLAFSKDGQGRLQLDTARRLIVPTASSHEPKLSVDLK